MAEQRNNYQCLSCGIANLLSRFGWRPLSSGCILPRYRLAKEAIMARKNAFYAQSGGVSAVINASACGVLQTARRHPDLIAKVYAGHNGILGALTEDLIDTSAEPEVAIAALGHTPGAAFGSCRY